MLSHSSFNYYVISTLRPLVDVTTSCSFYFYFSLYSPSSSPPVTKTVSALSVTATSPGPRKSDISELSGNLTNDLEYTYSSPSAYTSTLCEEINRNLCPTSRDGIPFRDENRCHYLCVGSGNITNSLEYTYSSPSAYTSTLGKEINQCSVTKNSTFPENHKILNSSPKTIHWNDVAPARGAIFDFSMASACGGLLPSVPERRDFLRDRAEKFEFKIHLDILASAPNTVQAAYDITRLVHEILGYLTPQSPGHDAASEILMFAAPAAVMSQKHEYVTYLWFATPRNYTAEFVYIKATYACISPSELDGAVCDARDLNTLIAEFPPERRKSKNRSPGQHGRYADQSQRYARAPTSHAQVLPGVTGG
ncbi:hypothetical protein ONZ45_g13413 [Pleurotus djamor]|nr:hypothetical protein ONZ45_g13413 [Pleurotus djamor]